MLVVRRRAGEFIRIGAEVELRLLSIGKSSVRLGIEAPRSIPIQMRQRREENSEKDASSSRYEKTSGEA